MSSYQIHLARLTGTDDAAALTAAVKEYEQTQKPPFVEQFAVLGVSGGKSAVRIAAAYCTGKEINVVTKLPGARKGPETVSLDLERVNVAIPFEMLINAKAGRLQTFGPGPKSLEMANEFLVGALAWPALTSEIEIEAQASLDTMISQKVERLQLVSVSIGDYSHNSYMVGGYNPKFLDSQHGLDFSAEYAESINSMSVKFAGPTGKVTMKLTNKASFTFSCHEDDYDYVAAICRRLGGW
jgi:hypothetical protein